MLSIPDSGQRTRREAPGSRETGTRRSNEEPA